MNKIYQFVRGRLTEHVLYILNGYKKKKKDQNRHAVPSLFQT